MEVEKFLKDYYGDKQHFKYVADFLCKKENFCHEEIIVVDSSQGFGKTFFSQKLKEYIKENQKNAIVVEYNLSKYDHGDCLIMFFHNLFEGIQNEINISKDESLKKIYKDCISNLISASEDIIPLKYSYFFNISKRVSDIIKCINTYGTLGIDYTEDKTSNDYISNIVKFRKNVNEILMKYDKYLLFFLTNADKCNEDFLFDSLLLMKYFFSQSGLNVGILLFANIQYLQEISSAKHMSKTKGNEFFGNYFYKYITIPPPNYKYAIENMVTEISFSNNIFDDSKIKQYLFDLTLSYYPPISKLKRLILNFSNYFSIYQDKEYDPEVIKNYLCICAVKYFDYEVYRRLVFNKVIDNEVDFYFSNSYLQVGLENKSAFIDNTREHRLFNNIDGTFEYIELYGIVSCKIIQDNNREYLKIEYEGDKKRYYYVNKSSSIDHLIGYKEFEVLNRYLDTDLFSYFNRICSFI